MKAIKETGNNLIAAYDPYDGVGVMDSYFPQAHFFTEFERFDRHIEKIKRPGQRLIMFRSVLPIIFTIPISATASNWSRCDLRKTLGS